MSRIFLDIGGWTGVSAEFFLSTYPQGREFDIYTFECDRRNIEIIKKKKLPITLIEKAAWTENGKIRFYYATAGTKAGGTLYPSKTTGHINSQKFYEVPCVDIAQFIRENFRREDHIIVKLNCEGAEYAIIQHLHDRRLLDWIDRWYVQWHWDKIGLPKKEHNRIASMIKWHPWKAQMRPAKFKEEFLQSI